jgi:hypothetical protein
MANKWITHVKQYAAKHGISYPEAMIKARASYTKSPKKLKGGRTLKSWGAEQYERIPEAYHPGIESIGNAALGQMGFGLKKRRPRKKGGDIWGDIGNAFKPVTQAFQPVTQAFQPVVDAGTKLGKFQTANIKALASNPLVKAIAKKAAKTVLKYGVDSAGPAAAAAATATGNPELAPMAAILAIALANEAKPYGENYIDGLGLRTRKTRKGRALMPAGIY